jgi:hypothetical protein
MKSQAAWLSGKQVPAGQVHVINNVGKIMPVAGFWILTLPATLDRCTNQAGILHMMCAQHSCDTGWAMSVTGGFTVHVQSCAALPA